MQHGTLDSESGCRQFAPTSAQAGLAAQKKSGLGFNVDADVIERNKPADIHLAASANPAGINAALAQEILSIRDDTDLP